MSQTESTPHPVSDAAKIWKSLVGSLNEDGNGEHTLENLKGVNGKSDIEETNGGKDSVTVSLDLFCNVTSGQASFSL